MSVSDDELVDRLFAALAKYHRLRDRALARASQATGGTTEPAAYRALIMLKHGPLRSGELAQALSSDPSTVSRHVAHLVGEGLVRREADPIDGRAHRLVLTEAGWATLGRMVEYRRAMGASLVGEWAPGELERFVTLLDRFVNAVEAEISPTTPTEGAP
ncbi:MarR family transcriptional regulator [Gordonia sp. (in: high G+C Gram-positive bacteria)]|uniref:MarR family winged helix-turn-helix transcriptional regulator n=1 Tax=Gordonia sp. (in: high G+C Gram-positive bacteria) TaxID=84139 RepID=UPI00261A6EB4|nr:MarR family transcriptional regulator [Gordonia sp. (in: high G+C Gram-positive bacteria)]